MATSVNVWDIVVWGAVALLIQLLTFWVVDLVLRDLSRRIEQGEIGAAIFVAGVKLAAAAINAAAIAG
jgi:putative membrane protein